MQQRFNGGGDRALDAFGWQRSGERESKTRSGGSQPWGGAPLASFYLFGGVSHPLRAPHHGWRVRLKRVDRHECFFCWCSAGWGAAQGGRRQRGGSGERGWRKAGLIFLSLHSAVPLETHLATAPLATRQSREAAPAPSYTSSLPTPAHLTLRAARPRRAEGRHTFQKKKKAFIFI